MLLEKHFKATCDFWTIWVPETEGYTSGILSKYVPLSNPSMSYTDCSNKDGACLLCKSIGCIKCQTLIIYPSRECVSACPTGYTQHWSTHLDYMGQLCLHTGYLGSLSGESTAVLVGIGTGALICVLLLTAGALYIRHKRQHYPQHPSEAPSDLEDSPERRDFLKQVEILRPHASTFLDMLNDTRRQIRELHGAGDNAAITAYRPVVRDLAKILLILNRPAEKLYVVPEDWDHLCSWGEKTLKRYKRMSEVSQPQVAQLWNFNYSLVSPNPVAAAAGFGATWQDTRDFLNSSYLLEDDFFQFGFRPQDEITTEL
ncbi:Transcript 48 [Carabus blaptoides fortunei]